jgi:hypothetical protein
VCIAATIAYPDEAHLFAMTLYAHTIGAEWECCNRINQCAWITPLRYRFTDRGIKEEAGPAECAAHDAHLAERGWCGARPECTTNFRGDALGGHSLN